MTADLLDFIGTWYILFQTGKNKAPFKTTWYILFQTGKIKLPGIFYFKLVKYS